MSQADLLAEQHFGMIEETVLFSFRRWDFPRSLGDDLRSAAGLQLVRSCRNYDGTGDIRNYLFKKLVYAIIDEVKRLQGRRTSAKGKTRFLPLMPEHDDDNTEEVYADPSPQPEDMIAGDDTFRRMIEALPNDRHREAIIRIAAGEQASEVADALDVSNFRIWQITAEARDCWTKNGDDPPDTKEETEWLGSVPVNWK